MKSAYDKLTFLSGSYLKQFYYLNIRLMKVKKHSKEAVEKKWQTTVNYGTCYAVIQGWIKNGDVK